MVQDILISHSGLIRVNSTVGVGSDFLVYLPVSDLSEPVQPPKPHPGERVFGRGGPILLVDDNERVAGYLKRRLSRSGYQVDMYTDPERALEVFCAAPERWNLVITDNIMPKYKGTALIRRMKQEKAGLSAILITGLMERDAVQMQQEGLIDEILVKPLEFDRLLQIVRRLEQRAASKRQGGEE